MSYPFQKRYSSPL